ncbi:DUF3304 domain-containing protein [Pseudomonas sp. TH03]|uniref:DUF3304 domain-containing protein n=1 Tax=Pseudomonas sp. TH03 TaxID=2796369 RepID=UPI00191480EC|nr:DUF3304 domain-containing protein [Pseudomonas sp. TH03]MBK5549042.1 DUF3304 domain-containing protein [Pseudomonas sp. TH03]
MSDSLIEFLRGFGSRSYSGLLCVSLFGLSGCHTRPEMVSTPVTGFNHTSASIIWFTVNGAGGHNISAFQGGGSQVCCSILPAQWSSGLRAVVEWDKDPNPDKVIKRDKYGQIDKEDYKKYAVSISHHKATVEIPQYGSEFCALQVHFLVCDQVKVSTTCFTPKHPDYPDKTYFQIKEAAKCSAI